MIEAYEGGRSIIYLDETIFKPYQVTLRSWASKYSNQQLPKEGTKLKTQAVFVMISGMKGLEYFLVKEHSILADDLVAAF